MYALLCLAVGLTIAFLGLRTVFNADRQSKRALGLAIAALGTAFVAAAQVFV